MRTTVSTALVRTRAGSGTTITEVMRSRVQARRWVGASRLRTSSRWAASRISGRPSSAAGTSGASRHSEGSSAERSAATASVPVPVTASPSWTTAMSASRSSTTARTSWSVRPVRVISRSRDSATSE
nr:hypothetical protein [Pseudonocardia sp. ICBG601]